MLAETIITTLRDAFPAHEFSTAASPQPIVVFLAKHPAVGDIRIWDEDDDVLVAIENVTCGHIGTNDEVSPDAKAQIVAERLVEFLQAVFAASCSGVRWAE